MLRKKVYTEYLQIQGYSTAASIQTIVSFQKKSHEYEKEYVEKLYINIL